MAEYNCCSIQKCLLVSNIPSEYIISTKQSILRKKLADCEFQMWGAALAQLESDEKINKSKQIRGSLLSSGEGKKETR
jgi:hypothetical protein